MPTPTSPVPPLSDAAAAAGPPPPPPLAEVLATIRGGNFGEAEIARFSDLDRADARLLGREWDALGEGTREALVRRMDELSEVRIELLFGRALRVALTDDSAVVRQLAVAALWEDRGEDLLERFLLLLSSDPSQDVRAEAARGMERFAAAAAEGDLDEGTECRLREALTEAATDEQAPYGLRRRALEAVGVLGRAAEVRELILSAYEGEDEGLRASALYAMGRSADERWLDTVLDELASPETELRYEAARATGMLGDARAVPELGRLAGDEDAEVRHAAIASLGQIGGREALRVLRMLAEDPDEADVEAVQEALDEALDEAGAGDGPPPVDR